MRRRRPLNDTIPEIRWMKEERTEKERRETVGKMFIWAGILVGRFGGSGRGRYRSNIIKFPFHKWRQSLFIKDEMNFLG